MNKMVFFTIEILLTFTILIASTINASVIVPRPLECECYYANVTETEFCPDTKIQCEPDKASHCFVLWVLDNVTGKSIVNMKGCFTNNQACNQSECIDYSEKAKRGHNFCCCESNMCNTEQKWIPTTSAKPQEIELPKRSEHKTLLIVLCGIAGIALISVFGIFGVCYFKNRKTAMFNEVPTVEPEISASTLALNTPRPIDLVDIIARGRFGVVWRGILKHELEVAVKIFPLQDKDSWASEQEIFKLPRMKHPNILEFIGVERHTNNCLHEFWLITCYHERGSLCDYLKSHTITWNELCKIAETMARGLMHLHEEIPATKGDELKPAIAHRDFKSKNVLLKHDLTACIADFGLALIFEPGKPCGDTHGQVGTRRYMAPEVLEGAINFTRDAFLRIDVYACGLVLWELVSRCTVNDIHVGEYALPFEKEFNSNGKHPTLEEMQDNVVTKKLRPKINNQWRAHSGLNAICDTMEECWDHDAEARLSSSCVMERIQHHTRYPMTPLLIETNTNTTTMTKDPINNSV